MIGRRLFNRGSAAAIAVLAFFALACSESGGPTSPAASPGAGFSSSEDGGSTSTPSEIILCKVGPEGEWAEFAVSQDPAEGNLLLEQVTLDAITLDQAPDGCARVWAADAADDPDVAVTITETGASSGMELDRIVVLGSLGGDRTIEDPSDPSVTVNVNFETGATVAFKNVPVDDGGGEGCTPGFWRQEHHFDSWPDTRTPDDMLTSVFTIPSDLGLASPETADPEDLTLLDALVLRGGEVNALIRHAVAALLNAESSDVDYGLSSSEVVSAFNSAVDGGDVEGTKNEFEQLNEEGCPLGEGDDDEEDDGEGGPPGNPGPPGA